MNTEVGAEYQVLKALKNWGSQRSSHYPGGHDIIADIKTDTAENSSKLYQSELRKSEEETQSSHDNKKPRAVQQIFLERNRILL
jgi:hypothetical protein